MRRRSSRSSSNISAKHRHSRKTDKSDGITYEEQRQQLVSERLFTLILPDIARNQRIVFIGTLPTRSPADYRRSPLSLVRYSPTSNTVEQLLPVALLRGIPTDVWWHTIVSPTGKEKIGYATQKPVGILRRIF